MRYVVVKDVLNDERPKRRSQFVASQPGQMLWETRDGKRMPRPELFRALLAQRAVSA